MYNIVDGLIMHYFQYKYYKLNNNALSPKFYTKFYTKQHAQTRFTAKKKMGLKKQHRIKATLIL